MADKRKKEDKKINVTRQEFSNSFRNHYKLYKNTVSQNSVKTRRLILFYSVECGLKSLIMKDTGNNTYEELKNYCECNGKKDLTGHDVNAMLKEVNPQYTLKRIRLKKGGFVSPRRFNELWRYGIETEDRTQEEDAEKVLQEVAQWIEPRI